MPEELTTKEVADMLGITTRRVRALITNGRLPAEKHGRDWAIEPEDVELVKVRKPGRPQKQDSCESETPVVELNQPDEEAKDE